MMNLIEQRIISDGIIEPGNILKINNILNQQIEPDVIYFLAQDLKKRFEGVEMTKILTIEISGIPIATMLGHLLNLPVVFARKQEILNTTEGMYSSQAFSFTHKQQNKVYVPMPFISSADKILIVDDFLANGEASRALIDIVNQAGATVAGIGIAIEKGFMKGGRELRAEGYRVESVAIIDEMDYETKTIHFRQQTKEIYLAGGCFWGTEHYFKQIEGVVETEVGFANGNTENPTYKEVYTDTTGYAETVHVKYHPDVVSLEFLLQMFFKAIDPTSLNKQGHDEGTRYRTGIYYTDPEDLPVVEKVFAEEQKNHQQPLAVEKLPLKNFYTAEEYHRMRKRPSSSLSMCPRFTHWFSIPDVPSSSLLLASRILTAS